MIISRTPFRVSFFGGGTDYPAWFEENGGAVVATTIDKYCYISSRYLPPFFKHKTRVIYSRMEHVDKNADIQHPAVREALRFLKIRKGVEVHHDGDLPARAGLGSSSSFTVGLLNSCYAMKGVMPTKERLAREAIHIEQEMCQDHVGCQDQTLAAYGGFNYIEFGGGNHLKVRRITISEEKSRRLQSHLMLFFTGFSRMASEIAQYQIKNIPERNQELKTMQAMAKEAIGILNGRDLNAFGKLLDESWKLKRTLSSKITTPVVDEIYRQAMKNGALGGKLLGAGGGGFVLLYVPKDRQAKVRTKLKKFLEIPFKFENLGSQIIFFAPHTGEV